MHLDAMRVISPYLVVNLKSLLLNKMLRFWLFSSFLFLYYYMLILEIGQIHQKNRLSTTTNIDLTKMKNQLYE